MTQKFFLIAGLVGLLLLLVATVLFLFGNPDARVDRGPITVTGVPIGGDFILVDQHGKTRQNADFLGAYRLVFFGFTFCPSVCPTELQKISEVMAGLGPDAARVTPLFISVDPERDSVPVMREFLTHFDPRIVGLTGTRAQVDAVVKAYKVYAAKVSGASDSNYMMDHSAFIYFMDERGDLQTLYRAEQTVAEITSDVRSRLRQ